MAVYWATEVIPMPITALMPIALMPLLGVVTSREICPEYFDVSTTYNLLDWFVLYVYDSGAYSIPSSLQIFMLSSNILERCLKLFRALLRFVISIRSTYATTEVVIYFGPAWFRQQITASAFLVLVDSSRSWQCRPTVAECHLVAVTFVFVQLQFNCFISCMWAVNSV